MMQGGEGVRKMAVNIAAPKLDYARFARQGDVMLGAGVIIILMVMLIPMPTFFLDIMLCFSISLALLILLTSMFMTSPLEFSIFPSLLLVTTLLRLALNVASTRLILLNGDQGPSAAGEVIQSFAEFVVGGSYVVGAVIFMILFILNKVVITTGTTRIAEVAARFTLDAMPGKQMAIEADLNAGLIDEEEATARRNNLRREADFYGAMDGAGKFVQGDVNAGLFITFINLIGGILIGVIQKGMSWEQALTTFSLLTIGDGLVSTIPSIIISVAAGMIVSRAAAEAKMGEEFLAQLSYNSRVLRMVAVVLFIFGLVPGLPLLPFWIFAALIFVVSRNMADKEKNAEDATDKAAAGAKPGSKGGRGETASADTPEEVQNLLPLDTLELEVGYGLIPLVDESQNGNLLSRIRSIRRQFALDMGVVLPALHLRDNLQLRPGQYALLIKGNPVASAEILVDHFLAMDPGNVTTKIEGIETREPAFNLPALWIPESRCRKCPGGWLYRGGSLHGHRHAPYRGIPPSPCRFSRQAGSPGAARHPGENIAQGCGRPGAQHPAAGFRAESAAKPGSRKRHHPRHAHHCGDAGRLRRRRQKPRCAHRVCTRKACKKHRQAVHGCGGNACNRHPGSPG